MRTAAGHALAQRLGREPERPQLRDRYDPVLLVRQRRDPPFKPAPSNGVAEFRDI